LQWLHKKEILKIFLKVDQIGDCHQKWNNHFLGIKISFLFRNTLYYFVNEFLNTELNKNYQKFLPLEIGRDFSSDIFKQCLGEHKSS